MIKGIIDAISIAIDEKFNTEEVPTYEIYTNNVNQGLSKPCFSIKLVNSNLNHFRGNRYIRRNQFCVYYFPESEDELQEECMDVQEKLEDALEYVTADGDLIRGTDMDGHISSEDVLVFLVNYDFYVKKVAEVENFMETISSATDVKG